MFFSRRFLPLLFVGFFSVLNLGAATVSFLVIETDLIDEEAKASPQAGLWESGLLDVFFEEGHIVTNAPVMRLSYKPTEIFPEEAKPDLAEALEGGFDYFVVALLDNPRQIEGQGAQPYNVSLRLFRAQSCELIFEKKLVKTRAKNAKEEFETMKQAARGLVPYLK